MCHNPYFNRWFSAIRLLRKNKQFKGRHNPYFNRWFSAIVQEAVINNDKQGHNPYFNRWFSAIYEEIDELIHNLKSQSLF